MLYCIIIGVDNIFLDMNFYITICYLLLISLNSFKIVAANPNYHDTGGFQTVEYFPYTDPNSNILIEAWEELGYKNIDPNADQHIGLLRYQTTSKNGQRQSTNGAFIRPIINQRSNLFVKTDAYVTKVIIDPKTKRTSGVEYVLTNSRYEHFMDNKINKYPRSQKRKVSTTY